MIFLCAGMKEINNELRRAQNELMLLEYFELREIWQSISIPAMAYEKAAASRFRTRIARIFADNLDRFASFFYSTDNKPQRSQSRIANLCALRVLCCGLTLFPANDAIGEME